MTLLAQLLGSGRSAARNVHHAVLSRRLRSLPDEEQHAMLAERREMLDALRSRNLGDHALAARAAAVLRGDWWQLDTDREVNGNG